MSSGACIAFVLAVHSAPFRHARIAASLGRRVRTIAHALGASVYSRQVQYITVQPIARDAQLARATNADGTVEGLVLDSVDALRALIRQYPAAVFRDAAGALAKRIAQGCVVSLARRTVGSGEIIGYELAERGVFSALGRRRAVGKEIIFSHWAEVSPAWRGQRIHALLFATRDAYFAQRGGKLVCGVVAPRNRASLQALGRARSAIVGTVRRVAICGVVVWETPWEEIEDALLVAGARVVPETPVPRVDRLAWAQGTPDH